MLSGRDALEQMDGTLRSARSELERLELELQGTSRALTQNKLQQARAIDRMASIRLDAARRGEIVEYLERATRKAEKILEARDAAIESINDRVRNAREAIEKLEDRRVDIHKDVDAAARALAEREAASQRDLEQDESFQSQLDRVREADGIAISAQEKAALASSDRQRKGKPYEDDELFMYLWKRGYGTSEYSANPLARLLDRWVARLCGYREARSNFWMLLEIPRRLAEHAEHAREVADTELDALQDIEEVVARDNDVPKAREALAEQERRQDETDEAIATAEQTLGALQAEQNDFSTGSDDFLGKAIRVIAEAIERHDIADLTQLARATMTTEDDAIVDELRQLRSQYDDHNVELQEIRELQRKRLDRMQELEKVRRNFKRNRYDDVHSRFDRSDMIRRMIGDVIAGVIQGNTLWNVMRRNQRYNDTAGEWPDFGSGGVTRRRRRRKRQRPPSWHWPGPKSKSGRGGGFKVPQTRSRSRGRGGFRTGGGF